MQRRSASKAKPFSDLAVRSLAQSAKRYDHLDGATTGLFLRVGSTGASWSLQYRVVGHGGRSRNGHALKGPVRRMHLGDYPAVSLHAARTEALRIHALAGKGIDPCAPVASDGDKSEQSLNWLIDRYLELYAKPRLTSAPVAAWVLARHWRKPFGTRAFASMTRPELNTHLRKIAQSEKHGSGAALEARRWIMGVFSWAIREDLASSNPAVGLVGREDLRRDPTDLRPRERMLTIDEARAVYRASLRMPEPWGDLARVLLLTLARLSEYSKAEHAWFDRGGRNIEVPGHGHKNRSPKTIPLSRAAFELIEKRPVGQEGPYMFSTTGGRKPIYSYADAYADRLRALAAEELGRPIPHFTMHDFRRTGATHLTAMGVRDEVVELLLGHKIRGVRGVYMKHKYVEERRQALELWASKLRAVAAAPKHCADKPQRMVLRVRRSDEGLRRAGDGPET
ncbi:MAG: phage integrase [Alphaproteobacteria bacterium]|nr:MAG: phage integrase [Caulobacteraceae bacterium]TPW06643.1 MAG: phage integrase [Alphaproteobacteria bacterium]